MITSCATLEKFVQAPDVKVDSVQISDISFSDVTLDFNLLIQNPNGFGVSLGGFDYVFSFSSSPLKTSPQGPCLLTSCSQVRRSLKKDKSSEKTALSSM